MAESNPESPSVSPSPPPSRGEAENLTEPPVHDESRPAGKRADGQPASEAERSRSAPAGAGRVDPEGAEARADFAEQSATGNHGGDLPGEATPAGAAPGEATLAGAASDASTVTEQAATEENGTVAPGPGKLGQPADTASVTGPTDEPDPDRSDPDRSDRTVSPAGKQRSLVRELPVLIGIALVLALIIKTFLIQAFFIPSVSMEKTLLVGDRVLVNKIGERLNGHPGRGQIVVFKDPGGWLDALPTPQEGSFAHGMHLVFEFFGLLPSSNQGDLIKRVIAVGGDEVRCCDEQGRILVNGKPLDEPYVYPGSPPGLEAFDVKVPAGRLWVMGDHRNVSRDSSKHLVDPGGGTIPENQVVGRAFVRVWPLPRMSWLPVPDTFERAGLSAANRAAGAAPFALGLVGAAPLVALRRRRRSGGTSPTG